MGKVSTSRVLVLWAHESSPNLGVAALARGSRDLLRQVSDGDMTFANYGARPPAVPWGRPRSLLRERMLPRYGMQEFFAGFDLIWDTRSGDSFADSYGLGRHLTMGLVHEFAQQAGTPIVMAPQTIGPFATLRGRAIARRNLGRSRFVFARDGESALAASRLGRTPDATTADLVFGIDEPVPGTPRDVLLNVSGLLWQENPHVDARRYREVIHRTVRGLQQAGREVSLLAHVLDSSNPDNDVPAVHSLAAELDGSVDVVVPTDLDSARGEIAAARAVVGSRMHACLNALSVGVPTVPLAYSRKFAPLLSSVGWNVTFDLRDDDLSQTPSRVVAAVAELDLADARTAAAKGRESLAPIALRLREVLT